MAALPTFPGRFYGKLMTDTGLENLVKPQEGRRLLFAHNAYLNEKYPNMTKAQWVYLLFAGQAHNVKFALDDVNYTPYGSSADAVICMELFGIALKEEWKATVPVSNQAVLMLIKNAVPTINAANLTEITEEQWTTLTNNLTAANTNIINIDRYYSLMLTVIYSICRTGSPSDTTRRNLEKEIREIKPGVNPTINIEVVKEYWTIMASHYDAAMIKKIMEGLTRHFVGKSIRLNNLVVFARNRNLTQYYAVLQATSACSNFPWARVSLDLSQEMANYLAARNLVRDRPYFGYGPLGIAAAANYPNLAYLCVQLCRRALGQTTLSNYISTKAVAINKEKWDALVDAYLRQTQAEPSADEIQTARPHARRFLDRIRHPDYEYEEDDSDEEGMPRPPPEQDAGSSSSDDEDDNDDGGNQATQMQVDSTAPVEDSSAAMPPPAAPSSGSAAPGSRPSRTTRRAEERPSDKDRSRSGHRDSDDSHKEPPKGKKTKTQRPRYESVMTRDSPPNPHGAGMISYKSVYQNGFSGVKKVIDNPQFPDYRGRATFVELPENVTIDLIRTETAHEPIRASDIRSNTSLYNYFDYITTPRQKNRDIRFPDRTITPTNEEIVKMGQKLARSPYTIVYKNALLDLGCVYEPDLYPYAPLGLIGTLYNIVTGWSKEDQMTIFPPRPEQA